MDDVLTNPGSKVLANPRGGWDVVAPDGRTVRFNRNGNFQGLREQLRMGKNNFRVSIGDDPEHEELTAEIYFEEKFVAIISQEKGFEEMEIEIFQKSNGKPWAFQLNEFLEIIELSKRRLWELRRI